MNRRSFLTLGLKGAVLGAALTMGGVTVLKTISKHIGELEFTTGYDEANACWDGYARTWMRSQGDIGDRTFFDLSHHSGKQTPEQIEIARQNHYETFQRHINKLEGICV